MIRRIRDRGTFSALAEAPNLHAGPIGVRYLPANEVRVAYAVSKRVGGAVVRNRIKRRLRAAVERATLPPGSYLVSGGEAARSASLAALVAALDELGAQVKR